MNLPRVNWYKVIVYVAKKTLQPLTEGSEGFGGLAGFGHADGIDRKDPHFIWHAFNHLLGFKWSFFDQIEVQSHPPGALFLFSLNEIALKEKQISSFSILV